MPMIPEAAYAALACARIGAIHSVVFGGFSADALAGRIEDCGSRIVVTADEGRRGGKRIKLKACVDEAAARAPSLEKVIVVKATGADVPMGERDVWYHDAAAGGRHRLPGGGDGRRGPAVHPLHQRFDRQAQGGDAHLGRVSAVGEPDASDRLRL
jgi:acyl-coenzyme A synthetase/AMP-(fatty) acid ligase